MNGVTETYITQAGRAHLERRREKLDAINSAAAVSARQTEIRAECNRILGARPEPTPLKIKTIRVLEREGYSIEVLTYQSLPGVITTANLYLPKGRQGPYPGIVCPAGHWPEGKANAEYQRLGQLLARRKIAALLFDQTGQGERLEFYDSTLHRSWVGKSVAAEHNHLGNLMLLTGQHLGNWMLWDAMRGLDVLIEHANVDPARLGAEGFAAGGTLARFLCCLEPRLCAAVTAADSFDPESLGEEDAEQELPGAVAKGISRLDLLLPLAPKPLLLVCSPTDKSGERMQGNLSELSRWYGLLGAKEGSVAGFKAEWSQGFLKQIRARAADFFAKAFALPEERVREPETPAESAETLACTETGQVSHSLNAVSIFGFHKQLARDLPIRLPVPRDKTATLALQDEIRARFVPYLRLPEPAAQIKSEIESRSTDWGFNAEKGRLVVDDGLYVPYGFYALPERAGQAAPVIVALHERGIMGISRQEDLMHSFALAGVHVMAIDVPGVGETRLQSEREDSEAYDALLCGPESQWARRALNVGLNLLGLRVFSVLRTLAYLRTREDVDAGKISIVGVGRGGLWGLFAAALDRDVSALAMVRSLCTYKSLVEHRQHNHHFGLYLPGCLREFDLPQVAVCLAPRCFSLINTVNQSKERCEAAAVQRDYALAAEVYKQFGQPADFRMIHTDSAPETLAAVMETCVGK